ncbi:MAG: DoxX family protein [Pyrinomonadaceae bacterium]|nr:DoxX family protein [Pyrinomonadaceae bacterium]
MNSFLNDWSPRALSVLRIIIGFLLLFHGTQKLFNYPPKEGFTAAAGLMLLAGILEFGGGALFLIGLLTRPVAFILCGMMAVAYFMAHASGGFLPLVNKGELAVVYCFVFFYFMFSGGGAWSLDNLIGRNKR